MEGAAAREGARGRDCRSAMQVTALLKKNAKIHMRQGVCGSCLTCTCCGGVCNPCNAMCMQLSFPIGFVIFVTLVPYLLIKGLVKDSDDIFEVKITPLRYHAPYPGIPLIVEGDDMHEGRRRRSVKQISGSYAKYDGSTLKLQPDAVEGDFPLEDVLFANNRLNYGCHCKTLAVVGQGDAATDFADYLRHRYQAWKVQDAAIVNATPGKYVTCPLDFTKSHSAQTAGFACIRSNCIDADLEKAFPLPAGAPTGGGGKGGPMGGMSADCSALMKILEFVNLGCESTVDDVWSTMSATVKGAPTFSIVAGSTVADLCPAQCKMCKSTSPMRELSMYGDTPTQEWNNCEVASPAHAEPIFRQFSKESEVDAWIADPSYGNYEKTRTNTSNRDRLCAAIIIENDIRTQAVPKYTIRGNITGGGFVYRGGRGGTRLGPIRVFLTKPGADFVFDERKDQTHASRWYRWSGFLGLQHIMHGYLLSRRGSAGLVLPAEDLLGGEPRFTTMPVYQSEERGFDERMATVISDPFMMTLQYAPSVAMITYYLCRERQTKQREIMKMMGLTDFPLIFSWMILFAIMNFVIALVGTSFVSAFYVNKSDFFLLFLMYYFFATSMIAFGMTISAVVSNERMGSVAAFGLFFLTSFFRFTVGAFDSMAKKVFTALLPAAAFQMSFDTYMTLDASPVGCSFTTAHKTVANFSVSWGIFMLFFDIFFWLGLYFYLDQVVPWHGVGVARRPWFCFLPSFWKSVFGKEARVAPSAEMIEGATAEDKNGKYFQSEDLANLKQQIAEKRAVVVKDLCKDFTNAKGQWNRVVNMVSLRMYEGECFCLLGHNGAGKTTTMSMITGCLAPTKGSIDVCGYQVPQDMRAIRSRMGFCPQANVLFDELTVDEHLWFFGKLGGRSRQQIMESSNELLSAVALLDKRGAQAKALSGGMKRKLSVAIAFLGAPYLIILDEPSSGMDPFARRGMWETLKRRRVGNVLCITTHYMDEADELGDRIAIMSDGKIACSGTPTFLKAAYGCGYVLALVKRSESTNADEKILQAVKAHCSNVKISSAVGKELLLQIPFDDAVAFPKLLPDLDSKRADLGFESYGISITNLEEVFLKVGHEATESKQAGQNGSAGEADPKQDPSDSDFATRARAGLATQFVALSARRVTYGMRDVKMFCMQLFAPNLCLLFFILLVSSIVTKSLPKKVLDVETWNEDVSGIKNPITVGVASSRGTNAVARARAAWITSGAPGVDKVHFKTDVKPSTLPWMNVSSVVPSLGADMQPQLAEEASFVETMLANAKLEQASAYGAVFYASSRYLRRNKRMLGTFGHSEKGLLPFRNQCGYAKDKGDGRIHRDCLAAVAQSPAPSVTIFENHTSFHAAPTIFNIHASAILKARTVGAPAPISKIEVSSQPFQLTVHEEKRLNSGVGAFIGIMLLCAYSFIPAGIISFIVMEKEKEVTQLLFTSGCSQFAYWSSNLLFDCMFGVVSMAGTMLVMECYHDDMVNFVEKPGATATVTLLLAYGIAATTSSYLLSFCFSRAGTALTVTLILNLVVGFVGTITLTILKLFEDTRDTAMTLAWIFRLIPSFCLGNGIMQIGLYGQSARALDVGPMSGVATGGKHCPKGVEGDWACIYLVGDDVLMLFVMSGVYFFLAFLIDYMWQQPGFRKMMESAAVLPPQSQLEDEDVLAENARVSTLDPSTQIVCVNNIRKVYNKRVHAVRGINFAAAEGQVFGLLGVNGAGKTTTFKMLCGQYVPTAGSIHVRGKDISKNVHEIRKMIGYCPQFDALLTELTVDEHLLLYGRLKGFTGQALKAEVANQKQKLDLTQYANSRAGQLSGGNKRKLSVAIATTGEPPMVFLDEPSAGMDPVARRFMWSVIQGIAERRKKSVVILTTHSMEEAEALCSRIAIQVDGLFRCMGSAQQIKSRYGQGLELNIRLKNPQQAQAQTAGEEVGIEQQAENEMQAIMQKKGVFEQGLVTVLAKESGGQPALSLLEGSGTSFRYQIFPAALTGKYGSLGELFTLIEDNREAWNLEEYQISQTTLEQIFNRFAATQGVTEFTQGAPANTAAQGAPATDAAPEPDPAPAGENNPTVVAATPLGKAS